MRLSVWFFTTNLNCSVFVSVSFQFVRSYLYRCVNVQQTDEKYFLFMKYFDARKVFTFS